MKPDMRWFFFGISGRISRLPYFLCVLFLNFITAALFFQLTPDPAGGIQQDFWAAIFVIYMIVATWITVSTTVKRLHDLKLTGWLAVILFIPAIGIVIGILLVIVLCVFPGTRGPNAYGDTTNRPKT